MATFECKGLDKMMKEFESKIEAPDKAKNKIITKAAKEVLKIQKSYAPHDTNESRKHLDIVEKRVGNGYQFNDIGINAKNWEQTKALYFQHYGFEHYQTHKPVKVHVGWMKKARGKANSKVKEIIKDGIMEALKLDK